MCGAKFLKDLGPRLLHSDSLITTQKVNLKKQTSCWVVKSLD